MNRISLHAVIFLVAMIVAVTPAVAQEPQDGPIPAPPVQEPPGGIVAPTAPSPDVAVSGPSDDGPASPVSVSEPIPPGPPTPQIVDPAITPVEPEPASDPPVDTPPAPAAPAIDPTEVTTLREAYADLKHREFEAKTLTDPASDDTRNAVREAIRRADEIKGLLPGARWQADVMEWYAAAMADATESSLPEGIPPGMTPEPILATVQPSALYYSATPFSDATLLGSFSEAGSVLRIAGGAGAQLVWIPNLGFAFMTRQSLELHQ